MNLILIVFVRPSNSAHITNNPSSNSPTRGATEVTPISPSSSGSRNTSNVSSPTTPVTVNDLRVAAVAPTIVTQTHAQQVTSLTPTINSLVLDSPPTTAINAANPVLLICTNSSTPTSSSSVHTSPSTGSVENPTNGRAEPQTSNGIIKPDASVLTGGATQQQNGIRTEPQIPRVRRSSRNIDESSRRRSSRCPRQPLSCNQQASVRSGIPLRPSLDLPPGYGENYNIIKIFFYV